ncbi:MAG: zinc ribbon domain-containing protein [Verrucomicrobia bacterium]|nr:zinc ribbon domain-containing protein [Verrucomicrobiota bacterium]
MPIYEYVCDVCGHAFEQLQRTLSAPTPSCPACGKTKVSKQFSTFSASVAADASPSCSLGACPSAGGCAGGGCPREQ